MDFCSTWMTSQMHFEKIIHKYTTILNESKHKFFTYLNWTCCYFHNFAITIRTV